MRLNTQMGWRMRLLRDPALALWVVCRAHDEAGVELRTADAAAQWLHVALPCSVGSAIASSAGALPSEKLPQAMSACVASSASAAYVAEIALAIEAGPPANSSEVFWLGLLHNALHWLESLPRLAEPVHDVRLPTWLATELESIQHLRAEPTRSQSSGPARIVAQAIQWSLDPAAMPDAIHSQVATLESHTASMGQGWSSDRSGIPLPLGDLAQKLARLDQLEHEFDRALQQAKLDSLKEFAYGAGHEINNPLANISARAQTLLKDERDPERRRKLAAINAQAFRAA